MSITVQQDATTYILLYFCKLLYMFRLVTPPIIRSTYNCNYGIWHWPNRLYCLPLTAEGSGDGVSKATNTHSQCVIHIVLPLQQWLQEGTSMLR